MRVKIGLSIVFRSEDQAITVELDQTERENLITLPDDDDSFFLTAHPVAMSREDIDDHCDGFRPLAGGLRKVSHG